MVIALDNECVVCQNTRDSEGIAAGVDEDLYDHAAEWRTWPGYSAQERIAAGVRRTLRQRPHRPARRRGLLGARRRALQRRTADRPGAVVRDVAGHGPHAAHARHRPKLQDHAVELAARRRGRMAGSWQPNPSPQRPSPNSRPTGSPPSSARSSTRPGSRTPRPFRCAGWARSPIPDSAPARSGTSSPSTRPASCSATTSAWSATSGSASTWARCGSSATDWPGRQALSSTRTARRTRTAAAARCAAIEDRLADAGHRRAGRPRDGVRARRPRRQPAARRTCGRSTAWPACSSTRGSSATSPTAATGSGVAIEQFHPEYGANQFEISLTPQSPVAAADQLVLMRIIVGRVARQYGLRVSLSPVPFAGSVGSGAHQHFSLTRGDTPLFSGGTGAGGMTPEGESAVAGVLAGLPDAQGVLCGSILSGLRMQPGHWSGAYVCWGTENREAAVRFLVGGPGNPHGANVEVKVIDPSANPYFATAAILGLALDGIERKLPLPPEITVDPSTLTEAQRADGRHHAAARPIRRERSTRSTDPRWCAAFSAMPRSMRSSRCVATSTRPTAILSQDELTDKFRLAWSCMTLSALDEHVAIRAAGRPPRPRLLAAAPATRHASRTGSTKPIPSRSPTSTRRSTLSSASRCGPIAHRCSACRRTSMPTRIGLGAAELDERELARRIPEVRGTCPIG